MIYLGEKKVGSIYLGDKKLSKIYLGEKLVWEETTKSRPSNDDLLDPSCRIVSEGVNSWKNSGSFNDRLTFDDVNNIQGVGRIIELINNYRQGTMRLDHDSTVRLLYNNKLTCVTFAKIASESAGLIIDGSQSTNDVDRVKLLLMDSINHCFVCAKKSPTSDWENVPFTKDGENLPCTYFLKKWTVYAVSADFETGDLTFYINGIKVGTASISGIDPTAGLSTNSKAKWDAIVVQIGGTKLEELMYNRVLTDKEINTITVAMGQAYRDITTES